MFFVVVVYSSGAFGALGVKPNRSCVTAPISHTVISSLIPVFVTSQRPYSFNDFDHKTKTVTKQGEILTISEKFLGQESKGLRT